VQQLVVFRVGDRYAGWRTSELAEVAAVPRIFPLPGSFPYLSGTAFLRGRLLTVVDVDALMGRPEGERSGPPRLLLRLAPPDSHLAVGVTGVETVIPFSQLDLRREEGEGIWAGLYRWEDVWVNVVSAPAVAQELNHSMAGAIRFATSGREHAL
jgi:chemotaxis signal transduction protein